MCRSPRLFDCSSLRSAIASPRPGPNTRSEYPQEFCIPGRAQAVPRRLFKYLAICVNALSISSPEKQIIRKEVKYWGPSRTQLSSVSGSLPSLKQFTRKIIPAHCRSAFRQIENNHVKFLHNTPSGLPKSKVSYLTVVCSLSPYNSIQTPQTWSHPYPVVLSNSHGTPLYLACVKNGMPADKSPQHPRNAASTFGDRDQFVSDRPPLKQAYHQQVHIQIYCKCRPCAYGSGEVHSSAFIPQQVRRMGIQCTRSAGHPHFNKKRWQFQRILASYR
jgi:hypothetical protein